jgi:hypothetical protein
VLVEGVDGMAHRLFVRGVTFAMLGAGGFPTSRGEPDLAAPKHKGI